MQIEKNIPMPPTRIKKYPFSEMEVGDSFLTEKCSVRASACAFTERIDPEKKFATRKVECGFRVWRIK
jgi:hypothetical protein